MTVKLKMNLIKGYFNPNKKELSLVIKTETIQGIINFQVTKNMIEKMIRMKKNKENKNQDKNLKIRMTKMMMTAIFERKVQK
jgi:hypothetical protein